MWTTGSGVPSVPVLALAADPTGSPLLAGTQGSGLYRSLDGGLTWTATGGAQLAGATVQAVHVSGGVALAAAGTALYRSADAGATWTRVGAGLPAGLTPSAFWQHPAVPSLLVLAAGADGLYRSADAGLTWHRDDVGLDAAPRDLAGDARTLVAATAGDGLRLGTLRRDFSLTATALPSPVLAGELVTVTIGVANAGPSPATGSAVTVAVPAGFAVRAATPSQGSCTIAPLACALGTLPSGGVATITVVVRSTVAGSIPVTIAATAEQADRTPADDTRVFDVASTDDTAPRSLRVKGTTLQRPFQTGTDIQLGWSAVDAGTGVSRYDVRYRKGTSAGRFEPFVTWQNRTARTNALFSGSAGATYCFSVRARRRRGQPLALQHREVHGHPVRRDRPLPARRMGARGVEDGVPRGDAALLAPGRRAGAGQRAGEAHLAPRHGLQGLRHRRGAARHAAAEDRLARRAGDPHAPDHARAGRDRHPRRHAHDPRDDGPQDRAHRRAGVELALKAGPERRRSARLAS